jgi:hypothetical protein
MELNSTIADEVKDRSLAVGEVGERRVDYGETYRRKWISGFFRLEPGQLA